MYSTFEREPNANRTKSTRTRIERGVTFTFGAIKDIGQVRCSRSQKLVRTRREPDYVRWSLQRTVGPEKGGVGTRPQAPAVTASRSGPVIDSSIRGSPSLISREKNSRTGVISSKWLKLLNPNEFLSWLGTVVSFPGEASWRA